MQTEAVTVPPSTDSCSLKPFLVALPALSSAAREPDLFVSGSLVKFRTTIRLLDLIALEQSAVANGGSSTLPPRVISEAIAAGAEAAAAASDTTEAMEAGSPLVALDSDATQALTEEAVGDDFICLGDAGQVLRARASTVARFLRSIPAGPTFDLTTGWLVSTWMAAAKKTITSAVSRRVLALRNGTIAAVGAIPAPGASLASPAGVVDEGAAAQVSGTKRQRETRDGTGSVNRRSLGDPVAAGLFQADAGSATKDALVERASLAAAALSSVAEAPVPLTVLEAGDNHDSADVGSI